MSRARDSVAQPRRRLRFAVGEIAIVFGESDWDLRWLGNGRDCEIVEIGALASEIPAHYDYAVRVDDGTWLAVQDECLRKKRPQPPREEPQVTKLKRDIKRWVRLAKKRSAGDRTVKS